jgi:hypothetical protein
MTRQGRREPAISGGREATHVESDLPPRCSYAPTDARGRSGSGDEDCGSPVNTRLR